MRKLLSTIAIVCCGAILGAATLFDNGKSNWKIVIPVKADAAEKYAATELQTFLHKISGVKLPVITSDAVEPCQIIIGSMATSPVVKKMASKLKLVKSNTEMISVLSSGENLYLTGDVPRGALYAVYSFLQKQLGCRWYWPGDDEEYIPARQKFDLPVLAYTWKPSFRFREMTPCGMHNHVPTEIWMARNFLNGGSRTPKVRDVAGFYKLDGQHWVSVDRKLFDTKPEMFSLINGERSREGYAGCWSNPEFFDYIVKKHLDIIKKRGFNLLNTFPADIVLRCGCAECTKNPDPSSRWYEFYAKLIPAIRKHYPDTMFCGIAYQEYRAVPVSPVKYLEYVEYCQYNRCYVHKLNDPKCTINSKSMETLRKWLAKAPMGIYGYEYDVFKGPIYLPFWNMIQDEIKVFRDMKLVRMKTELGINMRSSVPRAGQKQLAHRLSNYIYARLIWNADEKIDDILNDWCSYLYGKGASAVKEYHLEMAKAWDAMPMHLSYFGASPSGAAKNLITPKRISFARAQFKKALEAVKSEPDAALRKRHEREIRFESELFDRWVNEYQLAQENAVVVNLPLLQGDNEFSRVARFNFIGKANKRNRLPHRTEMRAYYTKDALRLQIVCFEPDMKVLRKGKPGKDISLWNDDMIEIFLDLNDGSLCRQLCVNISGGTFDAIGMDKSWDCNFSGKTTLEKDRWIMDITLPFKSFNFKPKNNSVWNMVIIRNSKPVASGFPAAAHQDIGKAASFVFSGKAFTDRRLTWIASRNYHKGTRFERDQQSYLSRGWQFRKYFGNAVSADTDISDSRLIVIETCQNKIPLSFFHKQLIPAVKNGAVVVFDCYFGVEKLHQQFNDPTFKMAFKENAGRVRKPSWIMPDSFAVKPNNLKRAIWHTPSGNFIPANPEKWIPLAKQKNRDGKEDPFILARVLGKGMVVLIGDSRGKIQILENLLEYNKVIKR